MEKKLLVLGFFFNLTVVVVAGANLTIKSQLMHNPKAEFRAKWQTENINIPDKKSVAKGVLFSAAIPGAGQFYSGSYLKGILFLGVEAAAITLNIKYNNNGNEFENEFEALADAEWNEDEYWNWIAQISSIDRNNLQALRDYEHATFSHFLPENKNQQYYENVGKYNQFLNGWRDFREDILGNRLFTLADYKSNEFDGQALLTISPTRNEYTQIRKDSNDNFKNAGTMVTIIMFNHVLSAIDAGISIKGYNRRLTARANFQGRLINNEIVPVLFVGVTW